MLDRKGYAFLFTIIIATFIIGFVSMLLGGGVISDLYDGMILLSLFTIPITLLFGIPVSILSDKINDRLKNKTRIFSSAITHLLPAIGFVTISIFILGSRFLFINYNVLDSYFLAVAIIYASVFWATDELIRCCSRKETKIA